MKIGYLGSGVWGFALSALLAANGHDVLLWSSKPELTARLKKERKHPKLPAIPLDDRLQFTDDLEEALNGADYVIESVTANGLRPTLQKILDRGGIECPFIITSKGIEQKTLLLLPEVAVDVLGEAYRERIGCLTGPSLADEVINQIPTSVVSASYNNELKLEIRDLFNSLYFRVYPNNDIHGASFGGAMKNIMAIACGISDGLGFGANTKAAIMTRGLHEMRKLSVSKECSPETLNGLSGMGDLCTTCLSTLSRNYMFGWHLAKGLNPYEAKEKIGMAIEGIYTCISARELAKKFGIQAPITQGVYSIIYENIDPLDAVRALLQRAIKEEHL